MASEYDTITDNPQMPQESLMAAGTAVRHRNTLTENLDAEIIGLTKRLEGLTALKAKLEAVPGVQEILDLLTKHGIR